MKIICMECGQGLGEKFPFDDPGQTHTICPECAERIMLEAGKESLRRKFIKTFRKEVPLKFDPETDSMGVE